MYKIIIPKIGKSYIEPCEEYMQTVNGYEMSAGAIGISYPKYKLRISLLTDNLSDIMNRNPIYAEIFAVDEFPRNLICGLPQDVAEEISSCINSRKFILWNQEPKLNKKYEV